MAPCGIKGGVWLGKVRKIGGFRGERVDEDEERGESSKFPSTYLTTVTLIRLFTKHLCR